MAPRHSLTELDERAVTNQAIQRLRKRINEKYRDIMFACCLCGQYGTTIVTDPGSLSCGNLTCADAREKKECKTPPTPQTGGPTLKFIPGSLVLAPSSNGEDGLWPGIIEDLFIAGASSQDDPAQMRYFVTLIFPKDDDRKWVGGFVNESDIQPFVSQSPPPNCTDAYAQSLTRANESASDSPKERLKKFSFAAHIARKRGIDLDESSSATSKRNTRKRRISLMDPEREESPRKRPRLCTEVSWPEESGPSNQREIRRVRTVSVIQEESVVVLSPHSDSD